ncbi:hypothetical protein [Bradyrhizobium sp. th.b2]|uniref:hypothetical protein n=1 Tax=Bradyrhizobium sp. th-b2 TaxID=172088 RepID=UPI000406E812|nr:hypothetical protein [Bradyrhizobium sp. th.b2]
MTTSSLHEDRTTALGWLAHGGELATGLRGENAKHSDVIWQLLVEAIEVIDKTPDQERRWLTSGQRSGGWNMIGMSRAELIEIEKIRLLSAMKPFDGNTKYAPQRNDIDRALGVLSWMRFCVSARIPERLTKAAVALARGGDSETVHKIYRPTNPRTRDRQVAYDIKTRTVGFIMSGLKKRLGIAPGDGITFQEVHP